MPKTIAITGASGLVGKALQKALKARGDQVIRFRRGQATAADERPWSPGERLDPSVLDGIDAVIHLAGEPHLPALDGRRQRANPGLTRRRNPQHRGGCGPGRSQAHPGERERGGHLRRGSA